MHIAEPDFIGDIDGKVIIVDHASTHPCPKLGLDDRLEAPADEDGVEVRVVQFELLPERTSIQDTRGEVSGGKVIDARDPPAG